MIDRKALLADLQKLLKRLEAWREQQALGRTWHRRPDLLEKIELDARQQALLDEVIAEFEKTRKR